MKSPTKKRLLVAFAAVVIIGIFMAQKIITTNQAHERFEGYCEWRGLKVVTKTSDAGFCNDPVSGQVYKMVLFKGRWFLDEDLPCGFLCL